MSEGNEATMMVGMSSSFFMTIMTGCVLWYIMDENEFRQFWRDLRSDGSDGTTTAAPTTTVAPTTAAPTTGAPTTTIDPSSGTPSPSNTPRGSETTGNPVRPWTCVHTKNDQGACRWLKVRRTREGRIQCAGRPNATCGWSGSEAACNAVPGTAAIECPLDPNATGVQWCKTVPVMFDGGDGGC